jgi:CBS domain-containing protein
MKPRTLGELCNPWRKLALAPDAKVRQAAEVMRTQTVGAVLVIQDGELHGLMSERDVVTRVVAEGRDPSQVELRAVMTEQLVTAAPDTLAPVGLRTMREGGFRHLPVVEEGRVLGMVSLRDFAAAEIAEVQDEESFETAVAEELW